MEQVLEQVAQREEGYETSVFYVRFRAAARALKPLTKLLHDRQHVSEDYARTLEELQVYASLIVITSGVTRLGFSWTQVDFAYDS